MLGPVLIVAGSLLVVAGLVVAFGFSRAHQLRLTQARTGDAWRRADAALAWRHQLVPKLIATIVAYPRREMAALQQAVIGRELAAALTGQPASAERAEAEAAMMTATDRLLESVRSDRALQDDPTFQATVRDLDLSNRSIAHALAGYDELANHLTTMVQRFPSSLLARRAQITAPDTFALPATTGSSLPMAAVTPPIVKGRGPRRVADN